MGIISPTEHGLYDVLDGSMSMKTDGPEQPVVEFYGFFIMPTSPDGGSYVVQYEGHAGSVTTLDSDDYDDVLELVDDLISLVIRANDFDYRDDIEGLVEWAGKRITEDTEKANERPDLYMTIPTRSPGDL